MIRVAVALTMGGQAWMSFKPISLYSMCFYLFLNGQPGSVGAVISEYFEQTSGLKINGTKTKSECVGHLFDSLTNLKFMFRSMK